MTEHCHYIEEVKLNKALPRSSYLSKLPAVKNLSKLGSIAFDSDVTFIVGENGSGKSTLLEAIAVAAGFNPEGGTRNFGFGTYDSHSELSSYITLSRGAYPRDGFFLRAESFYNLASYIEEIDNLPAAAPPVIGGYGGVSLHEQSHGESFLAVIKNRFGGNGLYILDEPEAALSPTGIMSLMVVMHDLAEKNSQFIISTHSPILTAYPNALIYELTESGINRTPYKETGNYIITKRFLNDPEKMIKKLFE
ncbi:MAG: AAA family ATPase [Ruminococcus sp.]|nr:AAA family ATPase [Ruminococcus sp.]